MAVPSARALVQRGELVDRLALRELVSGDHLASLLRVDAAQAWFESMPRCGHVISADNIINLAELEASGRLVSGDRILTFMAGFGSNWQCLILERI